MEIEIFRHRRLLWELVKRDLRMRYVGSIMGFFWSVINPLIMLIIYIFVFSLIFQFGDDSSDAASVAEGAEDIRKAIKGKMEYFPVFLCCALLPWNAILEAFLTASNVIAGSGGLIKKAVFPVAILPMQSIVASFVNLTITLLLFGVFLLIIGRFPGFGFLMIVPLMILQFILIVGLCYLFATVNVFFRDMGQIVFAVMNFWFWLTPMVYPATYATERVGWTTYLFLLNPVAHLVGLYRICLYDSIPNTYDEFGIAFPVYGSVLYLLALGGLFYIVGKYMFTRSQPHFVDEV